MAKVTVIIPTYNRSKMVVEAVESVLNQSFKDFELLIVDDGSTDDTRQRLEPYSHRLRYLYQSNQGPAAARNKGIVLSRGELIAFLDSDDLWHQEKLGKQVDMMDNEPELMIGHCEEIWLRNGKRVMPKPRHQKSGSWLFDRSLELCLVSPSAVILRRQLLKEVGLFDESLPACEDYDLWLRILYRYPIGFIEDPLVTKRGGHPGQQSQQIEALDKYRILALKKLIHSEPLTREQRALAHQELRAKARVYAQGCQKRGRLSEAQFFLSL